MNLHLPAFSILVLGLLAVGLVFAGRRVRRRGQEAARRIQRLQELWAQATPQQRTEVFRRRLQEHDESPAADRPGSEGARAETAFYVGCAHLAEGDLAAAARMFQVAYHTDPALPTALVLAFACLKAGAGRRGDLADECAETWRELGSPTLGRGRRERMLLRPGGGAREVLAPLMGLAPGGDGPGRMQV